MGDTDKLAREFVDLILSSKYAVALTGAGISTESGIPDYRSPGTGLWENTDMSVVSLGGFLRDPAKYYLYADNFCFNDEILKTTYWTHLPKPPTK